MVVAHQQSTEGTARHYTIGPHDRHLGWEADRCCNWPQTGISTEEQHCRLHWQRSSSRKSPTTCPLVSPSRNRGWGQLCGGAGKFKATTLGPPCLSTQAGGREFGALGWDGVALPSSSVPGLPHGPRPSAGRSVIPCNRHISAVKQSFIDRKNSHHHQDGGGR